MRPDGERAVGAGIDVNLLSWYKGTMKIERVQTGIRLEKRLVKVMKALAEHKDIGLADLIEGVMLHVFEGRAPFSAETLDVIDRLKGIYGLDLTAADAHRLEETSP